MAAWTTGQDDILRELCYYGAERVREEIKKRYGIERSLQAIEKRASRIHVSLKVKEVCPDCGAVGVHLNRQTGLCPRCTEAYHLQVEIAFNECLQKELEQSQEPKVIAEIRRERDKMRQRNSRLCRKYGLTPRRDRPDWK